MEDRTTIDQPATQPLLCQYGGRFHPPAEIFDIDGRWCSPQCRTNDRQSEVTTWRRAVAA